MKNLTRNQKIIFGAIGGVIALCVVCFVVSFIFSLVNAGLQSAETITTNVEQPTETAIPQEPEPTAIPPTATLEIIEPTATPLPPTEEPTAIQPEPTQETASNLTGDVVLEVNINDVDTGRPTITGQTNLPDGTSLLTSITKLVLLTRLTPIKRHLKQKPLLFIKSCNSYLIPDMRWKHIEESELIPV